jgi:hypothetical protein
VKFQIEKDTARIIWVADNLEKLIAYVHCEINSYQRHFISLYIVTSARRLCNHLGLYVCMCVCMCVCVCVFVCEHDNSRNTKHIHTKFFECISHRLRKSWLKFGWIWLKIGTQCVHVACPLSSAEALVAFPFLRPFPPALLRPVAPPVFRVQPCKV